MSIYNFISFFLNNTELIILSCEILILKIIINTRDSLIIKFKSNLQKETGHNTVTNDN